MITRLADGTFKVTLGGRTGYVDTYTEAKELLYQWETTLITSAQ